MCKKNKNPKRCNVNSSFRYFLIFIIFINTKLIFSQVIYERLNSNVYEFLEKLDIRGIINLPSESKPFTEKFIVEKLYEIQTKTFQLNQLEELELKKFIDYYDRNYNKIFIPYKHREGKFKFNISPLGSYSIDFLHKQRRFTRTIGINIKTSYENFSSYIHLQDRGEFGDFYDDSKQITPERGYEFQKVNIGKFNGIEFSDVLGGVTLDYKWSNIGIYKDYNLWGHGQYGNLILSDKANAFPYIKFEFSPVNWFRFRYIYGWLNSKVIDSGYYYYSNPGSRMNEKVYDFINKYLVINMFSFQPVGNFIFSIGNSLIYSGNNTRLETLLPFAFFKYLDRDVGKGQISDGNGQLFFDLSYKPIKGIKLYGTFYIDVISIRKTLKGDDSDNWFAYTVGTSSFNIPLDNFGLTIEYTKIDPWVYEHKDITTTYKHLNYTLGHWLGQNGDVFTCELKYFLLHNLRFSLKYESLRKGGLDDIYYAYNGRDEKTLKFLYPPVRRDKKLSFITQYEPVSSFLLDFKAVYSKIVDDDYTRTPDYLRGNKLFLSFGFSYGFPYGIDH